MTTTPNFLYPRDLHSQADYPTGFPGRKPREGEPPRIRVALTFRECEEA